MTAGVEMPRNAERAFDYKGYFALLVVIFITVFTLPSDWGKAKQVSIGHVWYYGWVTAISTGAGVIPFFFISEPNKFWMGISNAVAGGMMAAASYSLVYEGSTFAEKAPEFETLGPLARTAIGFGFGILFILLTKKLLERYENLELGDIAGANAQKVILIVFVMTLHSLTEGIGIGVSFGGSSGMHLGQFISLSLAVHNVPEGLAVALVMTSRKVSRLRAGLWAIFTSIPQPITAIPAFIFVERFVPMLPMGLGFAAGAMSYVAVFELLTEAIEDSSALVTGITSTMAFGAMMLAQDAVKASI